MRNIYKQYGNFRASDNVSFGIEKGKLAALLGPSGSGKTTIVNMITRLLDVTSGTVYLDGEEITNLSGKKLKPVYKKNADGVSDSDRKL